MAKYAVYSINNKYLHIICENETNINFIYDNKYMPTTFVDIKLNNPVLNYIPCIIYDIFTNPPNNCIVNQNNYTITWNIEIPRIQQPIILNIVLTETIYDIKNNVALLPPPLPPQYNGDNKNTYTNNAIMHESELFLMATWRIHPLLLQYIPSNSARVVGSVVHNMLLRSTYSDKYITYLTDNKFVGDTDNKIIQILNWDDVEHPFNYINRGFVVWFNMLIIEMCGYEIVRHRGKCVFNIETVNAYHNNYFTIQKDTRPSYTIVKEAFYIERIYYMHAFIIAKTNTYKYTYEMQMTRPTDGDRTLNTICGIPPWSCDDIYMVDDRVIYKKYNTINKTNITDIALGVIKKIKTIVAIFEE